MLHYASLFTSVQLDQANKISELEPQNFGILKVIAFWPCCSDAVAFQEMLGGPTSYYQRRSTQHTLCIEMGMRAFE
jgi:hypothetical protein